MARKRTQQTRSTPAPGGAGSITAKAAAPQPPPQAASAIALETPQPPPSTFGRLWPYLFLAALTVVFFWDSFFAGKAFLMRDVFCDGYPWRLFTRQAFHAGRLPLWNPYSLCGQPYLANPQTAVLYPLHVLYYVLPPVFGLKAWMALHLFIAAASMHALARYWKLSVAPALLAGISFAFSAHIISMLEFQSAVPALTFSPLTVLLASKLVDASGGLPGLQGGVLGWVRRLAPLTAAVALLYATIYLAGHQQSMINGLFIVILYLLARALALRDWPRMLRCAAAYGCAGLLAIGVCLPQLLAMVELLPFSIRSKVFDPDMNVASFHPIWFLNWVLPFLGGRPGHFDQWWGETHGIFEYWAGAVYIGIIPAIFATAALACLRRGEAPRRGGLSRRFLALTFLAVFAFGMIMAMGKYTPVYELFYNYAPVFNKLRWPTKFLQLVVFATSVLAALGFQSMLEGGQALRRWVAPAWAAVFMLLAGGAIIAPHSHGLFTWLTAGAYQEMPGRPDRIAGLARDWRIAMLFMGLGLAALLPFILGRTRGRQGQAAQAAIVLLTFINLAVIGRQIHPIGTDKVYTAAPAPSLVKLSQQEPCRVASLYMEDMQYLLYGQGDPKLYNLSAQTLAGETGLPHNVFHIHGGDVLKLETYDKFRKTLFSSKLSADLKDRIASLLNIRMFLAGPPAEDIIRSGKTPDRIEALTLDRSMPRAMVMENWRVVADEEETKKILLDIAHDPSRTVLINQAPDGLPAEQAFVPINPQKPRTTLAGAGVASVTYDWNRVDVVAEAKRPSLLYLADIDYPAWQAAVDGKPERILRANLLFRAVKLPPGRHTVSFVYNPGRVSVGFAASALSLLAIAALGLAGPLSRRLGRRRQNSLAIDPPSPT